MRDYYYLAKPGIIRGNLIVAIAGFLFASYGSIDFINLLAMAAGLSLIIGSACVFNNYMDRSIDEKMERTKKRALVSGKIPVSHALIYGTLLGFAGSFILGWFVNSLTLLVALTGFVFYVAVYGFFKRRSVHGTLVGSISGAIPPVVGYTAVAGRLDLIAYLLFFVLVAWQMPHFYAIAMYRKKDYEAAGIPVLPILHGNKAAKHQIVIYIVMFIFVTMLLSYFRYTGLTYTFVVLAAGLWWLWEAREGFNTKEDEVWAKKLFVISLKVLMVFSLMISIDYWLP